MMRSTIRASSGHGLLFLALVALAVLETAGAATDRSARVSAGNQVYWVEQLASGLNFPYCITWLPDGDALITERQGGIRVFRHNELVPEPLTGVPASFQNSVNGLKDLVLDPDYSSNHTVYLLTSEGTFDDHHTAVYRARYTGQGLIDVNRIFRQKENVGGIGQSSTRMVLMADKTLLVAIPENHYFKPMAQRLDSHIGKTVRINLDGSVPSDNPFLHTPNALPEIWTYGHRSQNGLYQDRESGEVWEVEGGPRGGDELNLLKPGANYGWAKATWGFEYNGGLIAPQQSGPGMEDPILVWSPSPTPSSITRYRGKTYPLWDGDYFVGELTGRALERIRIVDRRVVLQEKLLWDLRERIRDVKVGPDNHLYILTDNVDGRLFRLRPGNPRGSDAQRVAHKLESLARTALTPPGDPIKGKQAFIERCSACHGVGTVVKGGEIGPDLLGVMDRKIGSLPGFNYSSAMSQLAITWYPIGMDMFLMDPQNFIPGTAMAAAPVREAEVRGHLIEFLKQASSKAP